jgi:hypothetical protein
MKIYITLAKLNNRIVFPFQRLKGKIMKNKMYHKSNKGQKM